MGWGRRQVGRFVTLFLLGYRCSFGAGPAIRLRAEGVAEANLRGLRRQGTDSIRMLTEAAIMLQVQGGMVRF